MRLTSSTIKALQELYDEGAVSSAKFPDNVLLNILKENQIVKLIPIGKTRNKVQLVDKDYLSQYLKVEFSFAITQVYSKIVEESSLPSLLKEVLLSKPIEIKTKSYQEIIQNIEKKLPLIQKGMTNRQMSSILFWGLSKVLDNKKEIVSALGGNSPEVMLNVCSMSSDFCEVLFIENYDTYVDYINKKGLEKYIIIYSAGFSTSSLRIREKKGCSLHYSNQNKLDEKNSMRFESWFYKESNEDISISFFGDFDFSGISIFNSLQNSFPEIVMYREGYDFMLREVQNDNGHLPEMASKENQKDPKIVNDPYCDDVLLPAMRKYGFFDQEGVII
jgi:hypothetical protein